MSALTRGTIVWPAVSPREPRGLWLWSRGHDLAWIVGVGAFVFAALAVPITLLVPVSAGALVTAFMHMAVLCNYPHYAATYQIIARERHKAPGSFRWLVWSSPIAALAVALGVAWPWLIGPIVRLYLTWSAYHYAAQHFGIASMYQARAERPLAPRTKRALQAAFVAGAVAMMLFLNTRGGLGVPDAFGVAYGAPGMWQLPARLYPLAVAFGVASLVLWGVAEKLARASSGAGLVFPARALVLTNFAWFVLPYLRVPGHDAPWIGATVGVWLPFAIPFFHCTQYLGVTGFRARTTGAVKPAYWFAILVALGLALFEGLRLLPPLTGRVGEGEALLLVPAVLNLHHFFIDGLIWKRARRPVTA